MHWYEGNIAEAITISKNKGAIFVVYIEGNDEKSQQITQLINEPEVSQILESEAFVAIKIAGNSLSHQQFSQIYKQTPVPSIYFIGKNGAPLDIITEANTSQIFTQKLQTILDKADIKLNLAKQSASLIKNEQSTSTANSSPIPPPNVICENGVCTIVQPTTSTAADSQETTKQLSPEEKVERAKELLEKKRLEKESEEKENERQKEIERRKMGQNVQKLKQWQEDQELKKLLEERERDKRENQEARNRVLAQIAQDKAERAAKFANNNSQTVQQTKSQNLQSPNTQPSKPSTSNTARLQFKLPDGRSQTSDFSSQDTLDTVHNYIQANLNLSFRTYTLATAFPRREFTDLDKLKTLLDLQLVPNAVLLVLPINRGTVAANPGGFGFSAMLWSLLAPFFSIANYFKGLVWGSNHNQTGGMNRNNLIKRPAEDQSTSDPPAAREYKRRAGETTVVRRHGNIHRLSDRTDSDDENNTWNGNSTQQM